MSAATAWRRWRALWRAEALSPRWLALWAVRLAALFAVVHLLGWREATTVLSGTFTSNSVLVSGFLGFFYLLAWFGFVLGTPALLLAAGIAWGLERGARRFDGAARRHAPRDLGASVKPAGLVTTPPAVDAVRRTG